MDLHKVSMNDEELNADLDEADVSEFAWVSISKVH